MRTPLIRTRATHRLVAQRAENLVTRAGDANVDPGIQALVARYAAAIAPIAGRVIGTLDAPASYDETNWESPAANLIADAYLAAARDPAQGGAQIALVNASGVRTNLPAGPVTYGVAFSVMPFGNTLITQSFTGEQIRAILEQQYGSPPNSMGAKPSALAVSQGFSYAVDLSRPAGQRVSAMRLNGQPIDPAARYRVVTNNYLAAGGDGLTAFTKGTEPRDDGTDLDALVAYLGTHRTPPPAGRITLVGAP